MKIKKEGLIAIVIGLIIGLVIMGGVLRARSVITNTPSSDSETKSILSNTSNSKSDNDELFLEITSPEDNIVLSQDSLTLKGTTNPQTYIAIVAEKSEHLIVPNEVGQFSEEIDLIRGANTIKITVYTSTGINIEKIINIVYTTEEI